jgi:hypothetical protein
MTRDLADTVKGLAGKCAQDYFSDGAQAELFETYVIAVFEPAIRELIVEECEACAKVAYSTPFRCHATDDVDFHSGCVQTRDRIVDAIRARGGKS